MLNQMTSGGTASASSLAAESGESESTEIVSPTWEFDTTSAELGTHYTGLSEPALDPDQSSNTELVDDVLVDLGSSTPAPEEEGKDSLAALLEPDLGSDLLMDLAATL